MSKNLRLTRLPHCVRVAPRDVSPVPPWTRYPAHYWSLDDVRATVQVVYGEHGACPEAYPEGFRPLRKTEQSGRGDMFWGNVPRAWIEIYLPEPGTFAAPLCCRRIKP